MKRTNLTREQIVRVFEEILRVQPRGADYGLFELLGPVTSEQIAEYIWDHYLGEPIHPTLNDVELAVEHILKEKS